MNPPTLRLDRLAAQSRLLQLASQALPTGSYAYSSGLEALLASGKLSDEPSCRRYLSTLLSHAVVLLELPLFFRMFDAFRAQDPAQARRASQRLFASRESRELQAQETQMARALRRVLIEVRSDVCPSDWQPKTFAEGLAQACVWYGLQRDEAALLTTYTWIEQQVSALCRLLPLGPIAGQQLLDALLTRVPDVIERAGLVGDDEVGAGSPGLALASAQHETQYSRIFRS